MMDVLQKSSEHTPTPWMTQPCGELLPNDVMIVADFGKNSDGIQAISTVARVLSIRQTKEVTAANAAFIVKAVNSHDALVKALRQIEQISDNCINAEIYTAADALNHLQGIRNIIKSIAVGTSGQ